VSGIALWSIESGLDYYQGFNNYIHLHQLEGFSFHLWTVAYKSILIRCTQHYTLFVEAFVSLYYGMLICFGFIIVHFTLVLFS